MKSIWSDLTQLPNQKELNGTVKADAVIIGGGMAGLLTAWQLRQNGVDAIVIEAARTASGMTKNTTAKITSQHNLIYDRLVSLFGEEKAALYASANEKAISMYEMIIHQNGIDCGFTRLPSYVYSTGDPKKIEKEVKAAEKSGIKAFYTKKTTLPFPVTGAVKFENQAQFQPLAFIEGILPKLIVYENTKALRFEKGTVKTENGSVQAEQIIVATHYPFINTPGYYFMRLSQSRSYVLALKGAQQLDGMYIGEENSGYSFRNYGEYLIFGGAGHRTGENPDGGQYQALAQAAQDFYPGCSVEYQWSNQDCMTLDQVPYIGQYSSSTPGVYAATGFNKWGMSSSMVSAMVLSDLIVKGRSDYEDLFTPQRFNIPASAKNAAKDSAKAVKGLTKGLLHVPKEQLQDLPRGHGGIVETANGRAGVFKDTSGECFVVPVKCPHLGCELSWNPDELSWDCPCHGSRFDYRGNLINNPAERGLV